MTLGKQGRYMQKSKPRPLSYAIHKSKSKQIKNLNVEPETIKFLEENISSKHFNITLGDTFEVFLTGQVNQRKTNKQMGLHHTKCFVQQRTLWRNLKDNLLRGRAICQ